MESQFLHKDLMLSSGQQNSSQASVYFVKKCPVKGQVDSPEMIIKIFSNPGSRSFIREHNLLKAIATKASNQKGFP